MSDTFNLFVFSSFVFLAGYQPSYSQSLRNASSIDIIIMLMIVIVVIQLN